ncbi:MAG: class I SAM-dependent methyltransferase [Neisseriaceae bacterium]
MKPNKTQTYYNQHAQAFIDDTLNLEMEALYAPFLALLPPAAHILDVGCGSGRDSLYFQAKGHHISAFDAAEEMVAQARAVTGLDIQHTSFFEIEAVDEYDGVWCCASLLHCPPERLVEVLQCLLTALKPGGVCYASFKYGSGVRAHGERVFTDMNEVDFTALLAQLPNAVLQSQWLTGDRRPERASEQWFNALIQKAQA